MRSYTDRGDRVLLWGMHPEGYWLSRRMPASRYLTAGFLTNFSGGRGEARVGERYAMDGAWPRFERELRLRPPELIVDDSRGKRYGTSARPHPTPSSAPPLREGGDHRRLRVLLAHRPQNRRRRLPAHPRRPLTMPRPRPPARTGPSVRDRRNTPEKIPRRVRSLLPTG
ncbi:hypothetical protein ACWV95_29665 [Streptomyces albus]